MKYIFLYKYSLSGVIVLIIRLANGLYIGNNREAFVTLELLRRMVTFNKVTALVHFHFSAFESIRLWPYVWTSLMS